MEMTHSNRPTLFFAFILCLSVIKITRSEDGHRPLNGNNHDSQVRWWKKVYGGLIDGIKQRISSIFHNDISPEARIPSNQIISSRGYPVEIHKVTTDDGYILELHRIPHGKSQSSNVPNLKRRAVFLQHGFLCSDAVWLILPSDVALAFVLADLGYDVWLGNSRGNTYSLQHTTHNPAFQEFWNFSVDEMGKYDIPAAINYILSKTGENSLSYVGHSMGCAVLFIAMTYHPELNSKIDVMFALAPGAANGHAKTDIRIRAPFLNPAMAFHKLIGTTVVRPVDSFYQNLQKSFCGPNMLFRYSFCYNEAFRLAGDSYKGLDLNFLPVIDGHFPSGTSIMTVAFIFQNYIARPTFQAYDFGPAENQVRYGQSTPLVYDLSKVTCPVYIFWGENDKIVAPKDVAWLAARLGNLKSSNKVQDPEWNHLAFVFSKKAKQLVYDQIIQLLPSTPH